MFLNTTAKTQSCPLPTVASTVLEEMWGHPGLNITPAPGTWREHQSTSSIAPEVGLGGMEGVISDSKYSAKVGVGKPNLHAPEEMWGKSGLDSHPASGAWREQKSTTDTAPEVGLGGADSPV